MYEEKYPQFTQVMERNYFWNGGGCTSHLPGGSRLRASKRNNLKKVITKQLNKIFEDFKDQNKVKPIDYIKKLTLTGIQNKKYRKIKYPYEALFKTIILMDITGNNQTTIVEYLKKHKRYLKRLSLTQRFR